VSAARHGMTARRWPLLAGLAVAPLAFPVHAQEADGMAVFMNAGCAGCHGQHGEGGVGPMLAGNMDLADAAAVVNQILHGGQIMPAFADTLSDAEIAAVASYVRANWGNDFGPVEAAMVTAQRGGAGQGNAGAANAAAGANGGEAAAGRTPAPETPAIGVVDAGAAVANPAAVGLEEGAPVANAAPPASAAEQIPRTPALEPAGADAGENIAASEPAPANDTGQAAAAADQPQAEGAAAPQPAPPQPITQEPASPAAVPLAGAESFNGIVGGDLLLHNPVSNLFPGAVQMGTAIENPVAGDPDAAQRGMEYFTSFNCVGCHAPNGGGGMGPSLSNARFIYGSTPADIYLSIFQGRPEGMPAWGGMLPDGVIWDLVTYIQSLSMDPDAGWGRLVSIPANQPAIEQVPTEFLTTTDPWAHTQPFHAGQPPESPPPAG